MGLIFKEYGESVSDSLKQATLSHFTDPVYAGHEFIALLNPHGIFYYMCSDSVDLDRYQRDTGFCIVERSDTYSGYYIGRGLYHTPPVYALLANAVSEEDLPGMEKNLLSFMEFDRGKAWLSLDSDFKPPFRAAGCDCYYIHDYHRQESRENRKSYQAMVNNHIFRMKDGSAAAVTAKLLAMAVQKAGIVKEPENTVLLCIAASTREKQQKRFKDFSALLSAHLGITDGYPLVEITYDRQTGDTRRGMPVTENIRLKDYGEALRGKRILLADDIYTSGKSFSGWADYLGTTDALGITGIFLARTVKDTE